MCTTEACQTIKEATESRCDEQMLHLLCGVNNELIAAEAKYHKSCFALYVSKSNLKHQVFREKDGESLDDEAFQELAESISNSIARGQAYDMVSLLSMYKGLLANKGISASSYTKQHLKKRFTTGIVFHQPSDKSKPELVYSSQIPYLPVYNAHFFPLKLTSKFAVCIIHRTYRLVMFLLAYCKQKTQKLHCNWFLITVVR